MADFGDSSGDSSNVSKSGDGIGMLRAPCEIRSLGTVTIGTAAGVTTWQLTIPETLPATQ